jgi:hypothetical protein
MPLSDSLHAQCALRGSPTNTALMRPGRREPAWAGHRYRHQPGGETRPSTWRLRPDAAHFYNGSPG